MKRNRRGAPAIDVRLDRVQLQALYVLLHYGVRGDEVTLQEVERIVRARRRRLAQQLRDQFKDWKKNRTRSGVLPGVA